MLNMISPNFNVTQNEELLTITVHAPYANIMDAEVCVEDDEVSFFAAPYHLRLYFPHKLVDTENQSGLTADGLRNSAVYDREAGDYVLTIIKAVKGQDFPDLNVCAKLLKPSRKKKALLEDNYGYNSEDSDSTDEKTSSEQEPSNDVAGQTFPYGFADMEKNVFSNSQEELSLSIDLLDPDSKSAKNRRKERMEHEKVKFDHQHYLYDFFRPDAINCVKDFTPKFSSDVKLTKSEKEKLRKLPRRKCTLSAAQDRQVSIGLIDILLSYCYNLRINAGDECPEASWNFAKLSSTLSWLEVFSSELDVILAFMRRSMTYPLYRNWELSKQIVKDTLQLLRSGRVEVLKCLLEMHGVFSECSERYILNKLYLTPYCCWIQEVSNDQLRTLAENVEKVNVCKDSVNLHLILWEAIAKNAEEELDSDDESQSIDSDDSYFIICDVGYDSTDSNSGSCESTDSDSSESSDSDSSESTDKDSCEANESTDKDSREANESTDRGSREDNESTDKDNCEANESTDKDSSEASDSSSESGDSDNSDSDGCEADDSNIEDAICKPNESESNQCTRNDANAKKNQRKSGVRK